MAIQIVPKRTSDVGKGYVVDGRVRHACLDPLEIGQFVKACVKHAVRCGRAVESRARRKERARPWGQRGRYSAGNLAWQLRDVTQRAKSAGNQDLARTQRVEHTVDRCPRDEVCRRRQSAGIPRLFRWSGTLAVVREVMHGGHQLDAFHPVDDTVVQLE